MRGKARNGGCLGAVLFHEDVYKRQAQPDTMSPIEAMQLLYDLKKKLPN